MISKRQNIKINVPQSGLIRARKKRRPIPWGFILRKLLFWMVLFLFLALVVWTLVFSSVMKVDQVNVANKKINKDQAERIIHSQIEGTYGGVFPRNNLMFIPTRQIAASLKDNFKVIKEIRVKRVFPKAILVELTECESVMVWCVAEQCYLVDETGTAIFHLRPTDEEYTNDALIKVEDRSNNEIQVGKMVIGQPTVQFLLSLPVQMQKQTGITILNQFSTPSAMSGEIRVRIKDSGEIIFNLADPLDGQMGALRKVLEEKIGEDALARLEYIDLRLRGRVVFKLKEAQEQSSGQEPEEEKNVNEEGENQQAAEEKAEDPKVKGEKKKKDESKKKKERG